MQKGHLPPRAVSTAVDRCVDISPAPAGGGPASEPMVPGQQRWGGPPQSESTLSERGSYLTHSDTTERPLSGGRWSSGLLPNRSLTQGPTVFSCRLYAKKVVSGRCSELVCEEEGVSLHWAYASTQETWANTGLRGKVGVRSPHVILSAFSTV